MKGDCDDYFARDQLKKYRRGSTPQGKANNLVEELLEKEEEVAICKNRLKELETAFYYNLEIISDRDFELSILERQLAAENEQLEEVTRERNELEDLIKIMEEKNLRKIQQLETRLSLKEEEVKDLQRENKTNVNTLKTIIMEVKQQNEKKLCKISTKFEIQKKELIKRYKEEIEEKEKYYLLEIDALAGELEEERKEREKLVNVNEENRNLKHHLEDVKRNFLEKENRYLQEIKKFNGTDSRKISKEVQCRFKEQEVEKIIQVQPDFTTAIVQTSQQIPDSEEEYIQKINFLQEQNEVLKYIVKDLKKNRRGETKSQEPGQPPGCECLPVKLEIEKLNKKFENEINNLKKILEEEQKQRAEEDAAIQSLENSVICFRDKLLLGLQEKLSNFAGEDLCTYTYNREIQNEIQVIFLEEKLGQKIDSLMRAAEEDRQKVREILENIKKEWIEKMEKCLQPREEPVKFTNENLLEKIRLEIQKLENKIETDVKNIIRNNCENNKCDKDFQAGLEHSDAKGTFPTKVRFSPAFQESTDLSGLYFINDLSPDCINSVKWSRESSYQKRPKKGFGERKGIRKLANSLLMER